MPEPQDIAFYGVNSYLAVHPIITYANCVSIVSHPYVCMSVRTCVVYIEDGCHSSAGVIDESAPHFLSHGLLMRRLCGSAAALELKCWSIGQRS